ncbi:MAG: hypothetical protein RI967_1370 [Planctomycetota bacterium]|jgi:hypothetical protein
MPRTATVLRLLAQASLAGAVLGAAGCVQSVQYEPDRATRAYPFSQPQARVIEAQVFNNGESITIVNATTESFGPVDVWLNQRYMSRLDEGLAAGAVVEIPLSDFWDLRGEGPFPGGLLRYYPPTPVRLVQLQPAPDAPLVGLVAIPTERELDTIRIRGDS